MKLVNKAIILALILFCHASCCHADEKDDAAFVRSQRSQAYALLDKKQYEPAARILKTVVDRLPQDPRASMDYGGTLFASASKYFHRHRTPMFDSEAIPILQEAALYLKKAADLYGDDKKFRFWKSHAYYLLGDIYHYGLIDLAQAKKMYQISLSIDPGNSSSQKEMERLK